MYSFSPQFKFKTSALHKVLIFLDFASFFIFELDTMEVI